jgi:hydrogenase maturation protein HypF
LSFVPLLARLADTRDAEYGAALFHATLAEGLAKWVRRAAAEHGLDEIVLGGGCFLNHVLSRALREHLRAVSLRVFEASQLPPNDGGLSLGQAWVAIHQG